MIGINSFRSCLQNPVNFINLIYYNKICIKARQAGIVSIRGSIGDLTFYKTQDGYLVKGKGGVDRARIKSDPVFQASRDSGAEFGRASSAGSLLRKAFRPLLELAADNRVISKLTKEMIGVIRADKLNKRGERNFSDGNPKLIEGFDFNNRALLGTILQVSYDAEIDRESGKAVVSLPEFVPDRDVLVPPGATHLKFVSAGAEVNFKGKKYNTVVSESKLIRTGSQSEKCIELVSVLPAGSILPLFLVFGVEFYQEVNGKVYLLKDGTLNALRIVFVNAVGRCGQT